MLFVTAVFYRRKPDGRALSKPRRNRMEVAVELVRKGATLLGEPCPKCGGIQVRYHGKVYCTSHEDLTPVLIAETLSMETVIAGMEEALLSKLNEAALSLGAEKDGERQDQLVSLMTKYFDLLQKLPQKRQSP